jgi:branched-chain amino acid transport system permease protein
MEDMVLAVSASIGIAVFEQSVFWATQDTAIVSLVLLVTIVVALTLQRRSGARFDATETSAWEATEEVRGVPAELAGLSQVKRGLRRAMWIGALVVLAYPWVMSPSQTNTGALYAIFGMVGVSLVILTGWAGQISLGQFGFVAVGALVGSAATARFGLPFPVAAVLAAAAAGAVAVGVGIPALRIKGLFLAVTTLAFALTAATVLLNDRYFGWLLPEDPITRPSFLGIDTDADERSFYYLTLACLVLVLFLAQGLRTSRTGRILIGLRDNDRAAQSFGVNLLRTQITAFAIAGAVAGFAGMLFAYHQTVVSPALFSPDRSVSIFLMSVLGGLGSVYAVLAGAVYFATATVVVSGAAGQLLAGAGGVLVVLLFFPTGIGSIVFRLRDAWLRRIAQRNRIWVPTLMGDRTRTGEEARAPIEPRIAEQGEIPEYRLESAIGETGKSQLTKLWRY